MWRPSFQINSIWSRMQTSGTKLHRKYNFLAVAKGNNFRHRKVLSKFDTRMSTVLFFFWLMSVHLRIFQKCWLNSLLYFSLECTGTTPLVSVGHHLQQGESNGCAWTQHSCWQLHPCAFWLGRIVMTRSSLREPEKPAGRQQLVRQSEAQIHCTD